MAASIADRGDPIGARNVLPQAGPPHTLHRVNEDRVHAYEINVMAALAEGDRAAARALTARRRDVAALAAEGLTNREIAAKLYLSVRTVEYHLGAALQALGLERRSQLANLGLADPAGGVERLPVTMSTCARTPEPSPARQLVRRNVASARPVASEIGSSRSR